jgi:hypothetical protein
MMPMRGGEGKQSYANDRQWAENKRASQRSSKNLRKKQEIYRQYYGEREVNYRQDCGMAKSKNQVQCGSMKNVVSYQATWNSGDTSLPRFSPCLRVSVVHYLAVRYFSSGISK